MNNLEKNFVRLTATLTALATVRKNERQQRYTQALGAYLATTKPLYSSKVAQYYDQYIKPFGDRFPFLRMTSVLSIIKKQKYETYHSSILVYLFDECRAKDALSALVPSLNLSDYEIETEHSFKADKKNRIAQGRIDVFAWSEKYKWIIVIENKVDACVRNLDNASTQLDNYSRYLNANYPDYTLSKILLSHRDNTAYCSDDWEQVDYTSLFNALSNSTYRDRIMEDYLTTLFQLLVGEYNEQTLEQRSLYTARKFNNTTMNPLQTKSL